MTRKALLISTYDELSKTAAKIAREIGLYLDICKGGLLTDGHLYARDHQNEYDVIISQGGTGMLVKEMVSKPSISIHITIEDYLRAFNTAKSYGQKVALVSYNCPLIKELESLAQLTPDFDFTLYSYSSKEDFKKQFVEVSVLKDFTIIGMGSCTCKSMLRNDASYVMVQSSEKEIRNALIAAKDIIDLSYNERLTASRVMNMLNYSSEGIFCVDNKGIISIMNVVAEKNLSLKTSQVVGRPLECKNIPQILRDIYGDGSFLVNETVVSGPNAFIVKRIHLNMDERLEETLVTFQSISSIQSLERKSRNAFKQSGLVAKKTFEDIVSESETMKHTVLQARHFSGTKAVILIEGETGTGKEIFAQGIHNSSPRCNGPFVAINCAALPENLLESELFGYDDGAFTGARQGGKIGLFELANNGTIFLDEIGDISPLIQSRLLRVLQEKNVLRIGGDCIVDINTRIIAATNKNLQELVKEEKFRSDLYYRLSLLNLKIPPLRHRPEDIEAIASHFILVKGGMYGMNFKELSEKTIGLMCDYSWPGNVRELENFIEKLIILHPIENDLDYVAMKLLDEKLGLDDSDRCLSRTDMHCRPADNELILQVGSLKHMESQIFSKMLQRMDGNQAKTARQLGISRVTLWKHLNKASDNLPKDNTNTEIRTVSN